jgi:hypothetical protein
MHELKNLKEQGTKNKKTRIAPGHRPANREKPSYLKAYPDFSFNFYRILFASG